MASEAVYHFLIRSMAFIFAIMAGLRMVRARDWKDQLAAGLMWIPLFLRAIGGK